MRERSTVAKTIFARAVLFLIGAILLDTGGSVGLGQRITPRPDCAIENPDITYRKPPMTYPMTSDRYAVQYRFGSGDWTDGKVYISYYGGTNASPFNSNSGYSVATSLSFVSIPARALEVVELRVTKLFGSDPAFRSSDHPTVRPSAKPVSVSLGNDGLVTLSTTTSSTFAGDQFLLWWGDDTDGSAIEGLVFFLDPPYKRPKGNVKTVTASSDLTDLSAYEGIDFEGLVTLDNGGASAFVVPSNIINVYFGTGAWVQGKLRFEQSGQGIVRKIYGPGVLDVSRFEYDLRACDEKSTVPDQGYHALSWEDLAHPNKQVPDRFILDGIVITDHNHATADLLVNGVVNNVKTIGWNGLNGGFRLGDNTKVSNVFLRSGDDSLMMWGASVTVTNATVWQNYNGAVVNLGWGFKSPGDNGLIDGLYVVRTEWNSPTDPSWSATKLNGQNNAVIDSLMVPGTMFGAVSPSVYRNIFVEESPRTLFSLKIVSPECNDPNAPRAGDCASTDLTLRSFVNLDIENLVTPPSLEENSIGFQTVNGTPLTGKIKITLSNVSVRLSDGTIKPLTGVNTSIVGGVTTNGEGVRIKYKQ